MEAAGVLDIFKRSVETKKTTIYIVFGRLVIGSRLTTLLQQMFILAMLSRKMNVLDMSRKEWEHAYGFITWIIKELTLMTINQFVVLVGWPKIMNTLQNCYGMVILSNIGNLYQMKRYISYFVPLFRKSGY